MDDIKAPPLTAGRDHLTLLQDFLAWFPDDDACQTFLQQVRWPLGFCCPACDTPGEPWVHTRGRPVRATCRHQTTATAGTIFDKTRTPLTVWFLAAWKLTTAKNGLSAATLADSVGVEYRTAWATLQRYRVAMVRADRGALNGDVEIDETLVGGIDHGGRRGRGAKRCIVVIALEVKEPKGFGWVRLRHVPDVSGASLGPFVREVVTPGSVVITDGWCGYNDVTKYGYNRKVVNIDASEDLAHLVMPGVHRVANPLKRWLLGTHQGSIDSAHL